VALEPVRQAVHIVYGAIADKIAAGLSLRHDHDCPASIKRGTRQIYLSLNTRQSACVG